MNDFTKEELIDILKCLDPEYSPHFESICNKIQSMIDNYCDHGWISINDRLPGVNQKVLVFSKYESNYKNIEIAYIDEGYFSSKLEWVNAYCSCTESRCTHVINWMPLPEFPNDNQ